MQIELYVCVCVCVCVCVRVRYHVSRMHDVYVQLGLFTTVC